jgi:hypothetical protein
LNGHGSSPEKYLLVGYRAEAAVQYVLQSVKQGATTRRP